VIYVFGELTELLLPQTEGELIAHTLTQLAIGERERSKLWSF